MVGFLFRFAGFVALASIVVYNYQRALIYRCGDAIVPYQPQNFGLPLPLHRLLPNLHFSRAGAPCTIIFVPGNGASVHNAYWHISRLYALCDVIAVEKGCYTQANMVEHLKLVVNDILSMRRHGHPIFVMGVSLGAAVVLQALKADHVPIMAGIILDNPFTSMVEVLHNHYVYVPEWLLVDKWNNRGARITIPLLVLTSERDEIIPPRMSAEIVAYANASATTHVVLSGALHGHAAAHPDYLPAIEAFVSKHQK